MKDSPNSLDSPAAALAEESKPAISLLKPDNLLCLLLIFYFVARHVPMPNAAVHAFIFIFFGLCIAALFQNYLGLNQFVNDLLESAPRDMPSEDLYAAIQAIIKYEKVEISKKLFPCCAVLSIIMINNSLSSSSRLMLILGAFALSFFAFQFCGYGVVHAAMAYVFHSLKVRGIKANPLGVIAVNFLLLPFAVIFPGAALALAAQFLYPSIGLIPVICVIEILVVLAPYAFFALLNRRKIYLNYIESCRWRN